MKSAGKARSNGLYRHIRTSKEIIRNLLNDSIEKLIPVPLGFIFYCASASISSGDAVPVTPIFLTVTPDASPAN